MENKKPSISEELVDPPCVSSSRTLESEADSRTGVSPTNSIAWHDHAYIQLLSVKEDFREDLSRGYQWAEKQQPCNEEDLAVLEMTLNYLERMTEFLSMPKSHLAHYSEQEFFDNLSMIMTLMTKVRATTSATKGSQPSLISQWLSTSGLEDSRGRHVSGNQSEYRNVAHSYTEARQITPTPKDHLTRTGATQSSFNNVLWQSLASGPPCTENNAGVLPNFNAQRYFPQYAVCPLPPLPWTLTLQNSSSSRMQVNLFREMESRTNLTMTRLPSPPAPIFTQLIRQQDRTMQPQMVMPHQVRRPAHNNQLNQPIGQNWQRYLISQGILPTVFCPDPILYQLIWQQDNRQIMQSQMVMLYQVQRPSHNNQMNQPIGQNRQNYLSSQGILPTFFCPTSILYQLIWQQDNRHIVQPQMVMPYQVQRPAHDNQLNQPIGQNRQIYLSSQGILPTVFCPDSILYQLIWQQDNGHIVQPQMVMPYQVQRPAHDNQLNQPIGQNRQIYLSSQGILPTVFCPDPILYQLIWQQDKGHIVQPQMVMPYQVQRPAHDNQLSQPIGQNRQIYLSIQGILPTVFCPTPILCQLIWQQDNRQIVQPQMVMPHQVQTPAHNNQLNQPIGQNWQNYLISQGIWPTVPRPAPILPQLNRQQDNRQMVQSQMVMPHQVQRPAHNNQLNQPIGQNRQIYLSSQGIRPVVSQDCTSLAAASDDSPQSMLGHLSKGDSKPSEETASLATASALPSATSTSVTGQLHVTNTDGSRNASHESDPNPATKKQKLKFSEFLFQEIELLNTRLGETAVDTIYKKTDSTHGTEVHLQVTYIAAGQKQLPNVVLQLQVIVQSDYPHSSPVILRTNPRSLSANDQEKALWDETFQIFDRALRTFTQPISVEQIAMAWETSAREACREYAEKLGGGSVSS